MDKTKLEIAFAHGEVPKNLDGFYKGELLLLLPQTLPEHLAKSLSSLFVPWKGKCFSNEYKNGDNILPNWTKPFLSLYPEKINSGHIEYGGYHAVPFSTSVVKGIQDKQNVLRLNYDLTENPLKVRMIVDEVVLLENNNLLGKVYLKEKTEFRLFGFFQLQK